MDKLLFVISAVIPSIISGLVLWYVKEYFSKRDKQDDLRENARIENNVLLLKGVSASLALGEATAEAIETQHWNGEMKDARQYACDVKHEIKDFMYRQGSEYLSKGVN